MRKYPELGKITQILHIHFQSYYYVVSIICYWLNDINILCISIIKINLKIRLKQLFSLYGHEANTNYSYNLDKYIQPLIYQ